MSRQITVVPSAFQQSLGKQIETRTVPDVITECADFVAMRDTGEKFEIDGELYDYFLDVLPPAWMNETVKMPDGRDQETDFGFAEGWETVTVFWRERDDKGKHYFAQLTNIMNPNRW